MNRNKTIVEWNDNNGNLFLNNPLYLNLLYQRDFFLNDFFYLYLDLYCSLYELLNRFFYNFLNIFYHFYWNFNLLFNMNRHFFYFLYNSFNLHWFLNHFLYNFLHLNFLNNFNNFLYFFPHVWKRWVSVVIAVKTFLLSSDLMMVKIRVTKETEIGII